MAKSIWLPASLVVVVYAFIALLCGANPWVFVDLPSFVIVPVAPFLFMVASYGWKRLGMAYRAPFKPDAGKAELSVSVAFFKSFSLAILCFGAIGSVSGIIVMLSNLSDKAKIGPNLAVALCTLLYAATFNAIMALPFQAQAMRRLAEAD